MLKKGKQRQYHAYTRYFLLLGFTGAIYIFLKIKSEIRIFDLINSVKEKKNMQVRLVERTNEVWQKKF